MSSPLPPLTPRQWGKVQRALMKEINRTDNAIWHYLHFGWTDEAHLLELKKEAAELRRIWRIIQEWRKQNV